MNKLSWPAQIGSNQLLLVRGKHIGNTKIILLGCCFTATQTVGVLGTGAQDVHLDLFHTAPELCTKIIPKRTVLYPHPHNLSPHLPAPTHPHHRDSFIHKDKNFGQKSSGTEFQRRKYQSRNNFTIRTCPRARNK